VDGVIGLGKHSGDNAGMQAAEEAGTGAQPPVSSASQVELGQAAGDGGEMGPDFDGTLSKLLGGVSEETRVWLEALYEELPTDQKSLITANLYGLMRDFQPAAFYKVVRLALRQYEGVFDRHRRQISIVGPVNVGKSSLYNALLLPEQAEAEVSPVPGTTRVAQAGDAGLCTVIDTPGGDEAAGEERKRLALEAAHAADSLIVVFDAHAGVNQGTRALFDEVRRLRKPMTLVLNKIDLVKGYEKQVIAKAARDLGVSEGELIPASATKRINLEQIVYSVIRLNPGLLALVSELLPQYRYQIAARYIVGASVSAFVVGSTPIPVADFFPLIAIQIGLVLQLGRVYGFRVTRARAKEVLLTLGGGAGLRELLRQGLKLVPIPVASWLVSGLYAAVGTAALGMAAREYWARGGIGSPQEWRRRVAAFRRQLWTRVRSTRLLKRMRNRKQAAGLLEETLEETPETGLLEETLPQEPSQSSFGTRSFGESAESV
jgi:GTP-binding protein Era